MYNTISSPDFVLGICKPSILTLSLLMSYIYIYMERIFLMFLDHTQRRTTVGRTPLGEWSARRRDLYLTTHAAGEWPQAACLLRSWVHIPPGTRIFVCCECRVLSGRGLCNELIAHPEESYLLWCVVVCDLETSRICAPYIHIYDIRSLRVNDLTLILLTWRKWRANNASK
jgi:hypothetical protein